MKRKGRIGWCAPALGVLSLTLLAGCGGGGTPSGNFSLGGSTGTTGGGTTTTLSGFVLTATAHSISNSLNWTAPIATDATTAITYDISRSAGAAGASTLVAPGLGVNQYNDTSVTVGTT